MSDGAFPDRLTQLKNRWESDPTSRIFLQLAEEYRHQGRVKEALDVLEKGLKEHPGYLSALVAKGRCLLELEEPEAARTVLERVVKQDATQMVANKLLVRAYLATGEPERARERLDLYSLLNDSDPDIEELRRRIRAMDHAPQAGRPDPKQRLDAPFPDLAMPAPPAPRRKEPEPGGVFDVFDLGGAAPPPREVARRQVEDVFELDVAPPPAAAEPVAVLEEPEPEPEDGDVFPGLGTRASRQRFLAALESEGLFFLGAAAAAAPVPAPILEPEPVIPAVEEPPVQAEPELALPVEPAALAPEPEPAEPIATATLGELYLRQGHLQEAERIFHEVLRREPGNATAQAGLARLAPAAAGAAGVNARKAFVLRQYLKRIREGSQRHVP